MNLRRNAGAAALGAALLALALTPEPERAAAAGPLAKAEDETYRVVYLGDTRPVLMEVRVRVDGKAGTAEISERA